MGIEQNGVAKIKLVRDLIVGEDIRKLTSRLDEVDERRNADLDDLNGQIESLKGEVMELKKAISELQSNKLNTKSLKTILEDIASTL